MKKIYNFFLRIETLNRAAFVMMLSVFFVGQVWGGVITFTGENLARLSATKVAQLGGAEQAKGDAGLRELPPPGSPQP